MKTIKIKGNIEVTKAELEEALKEFNKPEFEYPMAFRSKYNKDLIVLFDGIKSGNVIGKKSRYDIGHYAPDWTKHTNTTRWQQIPYDKERGFYHGQMVYCWDSDYTHCVHIRFYDAINECVFGYSGNMNGWKYGNYSATMPEFMNKAYDTLEGINDEYKG